MPLGTTRLARCHVERFDRQRLLPRSLVLDDSDTITVVDDTVDQMHDLYCAPFISSTRLQT